MGASHGVGSSSIDLEAREFFLLIEMHGFVPCPRSQTPFFTVRLWCAFTTESMAIGYGSTRDMKAKVSNV